jgi:hypothetical protein
MKLLGKLGVTLLLALPLGCKLQKVTSPPITLKYKVTSVSVYPDRVYVSMRVVGGDEEKLGFDGKEFDLILDRGEETKYHPDEVLVLGFTQPEDSYELPR